MAKTIHNRDLCSSPATKGDTPVSHIWICPTRYLLGYCNQDDQYQFIRQKHMQYKMLFISKVKIREYERMSTNSLNLIAYATKPTII